MTRESKYQATEPVVEISGDSGFCFGVVNAIKTAETNLVNAKQLYCLGDIVHNEQEVNRLNKMGLKIINYDDLEKLHGETIIFRAHGEPRSSYAKVKEKQNTLIDATCPVVLKIQKRIAQIAESTDGQILIYGKQTHPEVIGLMDQTQGKGICIETPADLGKVNFERPVVLFSQTTQSIAGFESVVSEVEKKAKNTYEIKDTICRQVACRGDKLTAFAKSKELLFFVGGAKSSNAKVLFELCKKVNKNSYFIESEKDIELDFLLNIKNIGICGATSTPQWLMENVKQFIEIEIKKRKYL